MAAVLTDTHALIWYLETNPQLSSTAATAIEEAIVAGEPIYVSAVTMVEVAYLIDKKRLAPVWFDRIGDALQQNIEGLTEVPFDRPMAAALRSIPISAVPDMPDRMIAASAVFLDVPLVTADAQLRASHVLTIW